MILTKRDKLIISAVKEQDFCFYNDIKNKFFPSAVSASHRLNHLKESGYICIDNLSSVDFKKKLDSSSIETLGKRYKVISLPEESHCLRRRVSSWKKTHQLLLFSLKESLRKFLGVEPLFDTRLKDSRYTFYDRGFEPLPDLYVHGKDYKLAVELELNLKSKKRYSLKMSDYRKSSYSHVLYVVTEAKKITNLIRHFKHYKYAGIAHYAGLTELVSYRYGNIALLEWLKKRTK